MKKFNWDKELKKVQKRGIYNPKVRAFSIVAIAVLTLGIGLTFSAFSYSSGDVQAFNSTVTKKVNITVKATNGYIFTLADKLLSDNEVKENPNISNSHTDKGLYVQKRDNTKSIDGKPTYYFRGEVTNNFVSFAGMKWQIVRINEDGTIRLISDDEYAGGSYNRTTNASYENSSLKQRVDSWYESLSEDNKEYMATGTFCNDTTNTASSRLSSNPTFVCPSGANNLKLKAGVITADELRFSGSGLQGSSPTFINYGWNWTMTQGNSTQMYVAKNDAAWNGDEGSITGAYRNHRYVINLKAETLYKSGDGTEESPYVVEGLASSTDTYIKESRYNTAIDTNVYPYEGYIYESVSCDNGQSATYDNNSKKLTISAKKDTTCTVKFKKSLLKDKILAQGVSTPLTTPGAAISADNEAVLASSTDDYGTTYYYRGSVTNNYVKLAGFVWRIMRINGDGSIRIILDGYTSRTYYNDELSTSIGTKEWFNKTYNGNKYVGYMYDATSNDANATVTKSSQSSAIKTKLDSFYTTYLQSSASYFSDTLFCGDRSISSGTGVGTTATTYKAEQRRIDKKPSFLCEQKNDRYTVSDTTMGNGALTYPIGTITSDELMFAGAFYKSRNSTYYLYNEFMENERYWWTMTPSDYGSKYTSVFYSEPGWSISGGDLMDGTRAIRPVVNLKADILVKDGNGSQDNPYILIPS